MQLSLISDWPYWAVRFYGLSPILDITLSQIIAQLNSCINSCIRFARGHGEVRSVDGQARVDRQRPMFLPITTVVMCRL
jgi:hypothetical protein